MSKSSEIAAQIAAKKREMAELQKAKKEVETWGKATSCLANTFSKAGALLTEAVSVGNAPVDDGRTSEMGKDFNTLTGEIETFVGTIAGKISELEAIIAALEAALAAALEEERRAAASSGNSGSSSGSSSRTPSSSMVSAGRALQSSGRWR